jgi:hypothetical protein
MLRRKIMAFRFIFWGDGSQNNSLADSFTQQAENDFRAAHQADFENLEMLSANEVKIDSNSSIGSVNQGSVSDSNNVKSAVISELIQAVTENKKTEVIANDISNSIKSVSNKKESEANFANLIITETNNNKINTHENTTDESEKIKSVAETIKSVSQSLDEQTILQNSTSNSNISTIADETPKSELKELLQKMRSFLDDLRTKVLSLLKEIQKPQLQYYYGFEDTIKDADKREQIKQSEKKQQELIEEKIKQRTIDKDAQMKLEKELKDQLIKKENQTELDKLLAKRMEESRKRNLFENNLLPK